MQIQIPNEHVRGEYNMRLTAKAIMRLIVLFLPAGLSSYLYWSINRLAREHFYTLVDMLLGLMPSKSTTSFLQVHSTLNTHSFH